MPPIPKPKHGQTIGWTVSVLLHGSVLGGFMLYAYFWAFSIPIDGHTRLVSTGESVPNDVQKLVAPDPDKTGPLGQSNRALAQRVATHEGVREVFTQARDRAAQMTNESRLAAVESHTSAVEQIKPKDMDDILSHIESSFGLEREKPPETQPGAFDLDSSYISDIMPASGPRKEPGFLFTRTDANGRTMMHFVARTDMSPEDLKLAEVFEKGRNNPNLKRIIKSTTRISEKLARETPATRPAGSN
jgi:hypothetical protein